MNILLIVYEVKSPGQCHRTGAQAASCGCWYVASETQWAPLRILDSLGRLPNLCLLLFSFVLILPGPKHILLTVCVSLASTNLPWISENHIYHLMWLPLENKSKAVRWGSKQPPSKANGLCWLRQETPPKGSAEGPRADGSTKTNQLGYSSTGKTLPFGSPPLLHSASFSLHITWGGGRTQHQHFNESPEMFLY